MSRRMSHRHRRRHGAHIVLSVDDARVRVRLSGPDAVQCSRAVQSSSRARTVEHNATAHVRLHPCTRCSFGSAPSNEHHTHTHAQIHCVHLPVFIMHCWSRALLRRVLVGANGRFGRLCAREPASNRRRRRRAIHPRLCSALGLCAGFVRVFEGARAEELWRLVGAFTVCECEMCVCVCAFGGVFGRVANTIHKHKHHTRLTGAAHNGFRGVYCTHVCVCACAVRSWKE